MEYPFSLNGRTIHIDRYSVSYQEKLLHVAEDGNIVSTIEDKVQYCNTEPWAHNIAERFHGEILKLNTADYEWLDGIEVADVKNPYAEAVRIFEMGQAAYEAELSKPTPEEQAAALEQQVTDLQMALCDMYEAMEKD